jgi:hypothetical protein
LEDINEDGKKQYGKFVDKLHKQSNHRATREKMRVDHKASG